MHLLEQPTVDPTHVLGNVVPVGAIFASWFVVLTQITSLVAIGLAAAASAFAIIYYILAILNDSRVKKWRNERRLRRIAYLKARVVGLEAKQIFDEAIQTHLPAQALPDIIKSNLPR